MEISKTIYKAQLNTTKDRVHDCYQWVSGYDNDRLKDDEDDANIYDTKEDALDALQNIIDEHIKAIEKRIIWGFQVYIIEIDLDEDDNEITRSEEMIKEY